MSSAPFVLQRAYASLIIPSKGVADAAPPVTYSLRLEAEFRAALAAATTGATRHPMSEVVFKMSADRQHSVRELLIRLAFGQTRTPLPAAVDLASRLASVTDHRTGSSLLLTTLEEAGDQRRISMYVFPEEESFTLQHMVSEPSEAVLARLNTFVLQSRLRKVARFAGKNIKSHFLRGEVVDMQIGSDPRTAADYWVVAFLEAEFAVTTDKGTRLVAADLRRAFDKADLAGKQQVMEVASALMVHQRNVWSLDKIAKEFLPSELRETFCSVAQNEQARTDRFTLSRELLKDRINYRVFQLESGVWVSSPFSEVGHTVRLGREGGKRTLVARGVVQSEKVQRDAKRPARD